MLKATFAMLLSIAFVGMMNVEIPFPEVLS